MSEEVGDAPKGGLSKRVLRMFSLTVGWVLREWGPLLERFVAVTFIQAAVVLAAQAFMALFPLVICVIAIAPTTVGQSISSEASKRLGMSGQTGADVQSLVASRDHLRESITALGVFFVLISATSFTRALQRIYQNAWQLPKVGIRASVFGLEWLVGLAVYLSLLAIAIELTSSDHPLVGVLRILVLVTFSFFLWWITPFVLLCGRARLRALLVTGVLTAVVMFVAGLVSGLIMPRIIGTNEKQFGTIGVVFAIESWLVVMAALIVATTILGAYAAQDTGWIGRWARGSSDPESWRRVKRKRQRRLAQRLRRRGKGSAPSGSPDPGSAD